MLRYGASVGFNLRSDLGSSAQLCQVQVHIHSLFLSRQQSSFMGTNAKHLCNVFLCSLRDCPCMLRYGASVGLNLGRDWGSSAHPLQVQVWTNLLSVTLIDFRLSWSTETSSLRARRSCPRRDAFKNWNLKVTNMLSWLSICNFHQNLLSLMLSQWSRLRYGATFSTCSGAYVVKVEIALWCTNENVISFCFVLVLRCISLAPLRSHEW